LKIREKQGESAENSALDEIKATTEVSRRNVSNQITFENYGYYLGFDKL